MRLNLQGCLLFQHLVLLRGNHTIKLSFINCKLSSKLKRLWSTKCSLKSLWSTVSSLVSWKSFVVWLPLYREWYYVHVKPRKVHIKSSRKFKKTSILKIYRIISLCVYKFTLDFTVNGSQFRKNWYSN